MRNIKLTIEYDGKDFNGWQKQPNKLNIQGSIESAIEQITREKIELNASLSCKPALVKIFNLFTSLINIFCKKYFLTLK